MADAPRKFPVPYGLFIVLGVYALGVLGYVWHTYWNSPEYKAAMSYARALRILGVDDGRKCSEPELTKAFELTLEAARLMPEERVLVDHLERLRHRFDERKFKLSSELIQRTEMMAANTRRIAESRKSVLVIGTRDKGWAPDQLLEGPERAVMWSIPGAVLIIAFWAYTRFSSAAVRAKEHEAQLKKQESEVEELGHFRRQIGPDGRPMVRVEDDADTLASPPSVRAKPPSTVKRKTTTSRPAVKRRPPSDE